MFSGKCVEEAAHGIEFAEIESENFHQNDPWVWGWQM